VDSRFHDLTNLLAELLDNATHFSQPESFVDVTAGIWMAAS
jgi:hypothetical protein